MISYFATTSINTLCSDDIGFERINLRLNIHDQKLTELVEDEKSGTTTVQLR